MRVSYATETSVPGNVSRKCGSNVKQRHRKMSLYLVNSLNELQFVSTMPSTDCFLCGNRKPPPKKKNYAQKNLGTLFFVAGLF